MIRRAIKSESSTGPVAARLVVSLVVVSDGGANAAANHVGQMTNITERKRASLFMLIELRLRLKWIEVNLIDVCMCRGWGGRNSMTWSENESSFADLSADERYILFGWDVIWLIDWWWFWSRERSVDAVLLMLHTVRLWWLIGCTSNLRHQLQRRTSVVQSTVK